MMNGKERTLQSFALLVSKMRVCQADYFRTRDRTVLRECRELEGKVDKVVKEIFEKSQIQGTLK